MIKYPWAGSLLTALFLIFLLVTRPFGELFGFTLAPVFLLVVFSVFAGGLWYGLLSAGMSILVEIIIVWPLGQYGRMAIVSISLVGIVWLVWLLQRKAALLDTLDGNIDNLLRITTLSVNFLEDFKTMIGRINRLAKAKTTPGHILEVITRQAQELENRYEIIHDQIANLTTRVYGWYQLSQEVKQTQEQIDREKQYDRSE